jgi:hypothetical protein
MCLGNHHPHHGSIVSKYDKYCTWMPGLDFASPVALDVTVETYLGETCSVTSQAPESGYVGVDQGVVYVPFFICCSFSFRDKRKYTLCSMCTSVHGTSPIISLLSQVLPYFYLYTYSLSVGLADVLEPQDWERSVALFPWQ